MTILVLIIFAFWLVVAVKYVLFSTYLWQLKEYRADRMRAHFELPTSRAMFINKTWTILFALLLLSFISFGFIKFLAAALTLGFLGLLASRAIEQYQAKTLKQPKFTYKALVIASGSFGLLLLFTAVVFMYAIEWMLPWLLFSLIFTLFIPTVFVAALVPVSKFFNNRVMRNAAQKRLALKNLLVIGITGSYGKTSMKEMLYALLTPEFNVAKTEKNTNTEMGVACTLLDDVKDNHDIFIAELGAYKKNEIARAAAMIRPQIGVLTGINEQHLSLFGSAQNIQDAKYELIRALSEDGLAIFNGDNPATRALFRKTRPPKRIYSADPLAKPVPRSIELQGVKYSKDGTELNLKDGRKKFTVDVSLLGRHNTTNLLGAITVARALGVSYEKITEHVKEIKAPPHTLEIKKGIKETVLIDDTYSANKDGVLAALETLARIEGKQKIFILQPLIELGSSASRVHKEIGAKIAEVCNWCIITSPDYFPLLYKEALEGGMAKDAIMCIPDARRALRRTQEITDKGDVILLENRLPREIIDGLTIHRNIEN